MNTTLEDLQAALEKSGNQCVTIYRSGTSHIIGARWSAPSFRSLPELSQFVAAVNGHEVSPSPNPPARVNRQSSIVNPS